MYRTGAVSFCRSCGARWVTDARACEACGEPLVPPDAISSVAYRPQTRLTRLVLAGAALTAVAPLLLVALLLAGATLGWGTEIFGEFASEDEFPSDEQIGGYILLSFLPLMMLVCIVALGFCIWLFEAGRNLRALNRTSLRFTEEARVWWFAIPVAKMFMPLAALRELSRASRGGEGDGWLRASAHPMLWVWWPSWVVCTLAFKVLFLVGIVDEVWVWEAGPHHAVFDLVLGLASESLIPALMLASVGMFVVVRDVARRQAAAFAEMQAASE